MTAELDPSRSRRGARLGWLALACVVPMIAATVAGSLLAGSMGLLVALPLAIVALVFSATAIALGIVAAIRGGARVPGLVAAALGVALDPAVLALLLPRVIA